tara:strand:+ start:3344 stop:3634 length:291 start_codon:yes stop_codon:yes gene_type:complete
MEIRVTSHAKKRLRQRLGINYSGSGRHALKAFKCGKILQGLDDDKGMLIEYLGFKYVYGLDIEEKRPVLISVYRPECGSLNNYREKNKFKIGWNNC